MWFACHCRDMARRALGVVLLALLYLPQAQALDEVTLQLKWRHQFQFAGYYMAEELGYYREAGLKIRFVEGMPGDDIVSKVLEGKAEFGVGTSDLLLQRKEGKPVVVLGVVFQHSPFVLIARNTGSIHDLHGKRLMIDPYANELLAYLKKEGMTENRRNWVDYRYGLQDLVDGRIDVMSGYVTDEPYHLDQAGVDYQLYTPRSGGIDFYGDNFFTTEQQIQDHPERVRAFHDASLRGWQYAMAHPEETIDLILTKYSRRQPRARLQYEASRIEPLVQAGLVDIGYMNPGRWRHIADSYADLGLLPRSFPLEDFLYDPHPRLDLDWLYRSLAFLLLGVVSLSAFLVLRSNRRLKLANRRLIASEEYGRKRLTQTRAIAELSAAVSHAEHIEQIYEVALDTLQQTIVCDRASIQLIDNDGVVRFKASRGLSAEYIEFISRQSLCGSDRKKLQPVLVPEVESWMEGRALRDMFRREGINALGCIPLLYQNRLLGKFMVYFDQPHGFNEEEVQLIQTVAFHVGYAIGRKLAEETIQHQANYDALTHLPNRRLFRDRLELEVRKAHRAGLTMALLFIDLDNFKEVNDTLGHGRGDELLIEAARRIGQCVRESDTVARLGGDEFTVILSEVDDPHSIERTAQEIIATLVQPFLLGRDKVFISASIGITLYPDDALEIEDLLKHADQAMYVAKSAGRNRYSFFTSAMQEHAEARMRMTNDLRTALQENQFHLYYQPIVDMASGRIRKAEALIRWFHPERGKVSPMQFIPLAEENGMIREIGDRVFRMAAQEALRLRREIDPDFQVSVNMSPVQFRSGDASGSTDWLRYLHEIGLVGQGITIEITESLLLHAEDEVTEQLFDFRDAGVQVAIDDFGTGYSSLAYLKKFDIDYLKIDRSFVHNLESDPENMALCEAIIVMAHKLGLKLVAEGVETEAQHDLLLAAGCDFAQGFLYSRPVPSSEFETLLREQDGPSRLDGTGS